jgi:hypothetical protein
VIYDCQSVCVENTAVFRAQAHPSQGVVNTFGRQDILLALCFQNRGQKNVRKAKKPLASGG